MQIRCLYLKDSNVNFDMALFWDVFLAVPTYTGPLVTQSASTIYAITRLAPVFMKQMLVGTA